MKLLFDHNLSHKLVIALQELYPNSEHVREIGMQTANDNTVWNYAREHEMVLVSKDSDFYYQSMLLGHPPKVVWIKLGNCKTSQIRDLLQSKHDELVAFDQDSDASFIVLS